ncbi:MAG: hypothetical protein GX561_11895 [Lentisphaerae bacterium]|jgi:phosphoglycerate dehydrogenase-like enzyme|nr:hypothetical protein [Lentisphaerota bacterium]
MSGMNRQSKYSLGKISVYLRHRDVSYWELSTSQANRLSELLGGAQVVLCKSDAELASELPDADAVLTWRFRQEWFDLAPKLKIVSTPAAGQDYFSVVAPPGVVMLNGAFHGEIMAESVVGMLLGMERGILAQATLHPATSWARKELSPGMRVLRGSTVLILGFGRIGRWIGKLLKPFGVTLIGVGRRSNAERPDWFDASDSLIQVGELDEALAKANHLVMALPSTTGTTGLMDGRRLALLKPGATVTNVGRGNSLDVTALITLLNNGHLAGAFLDVFPEEPLPEGSVIASTPKLWRLPHASAIAPNYLDLYIDDFVRQVRGLS